MSCPDGSCWREKSNGRSTGLLPEKYRFRVRGMNRRALPVRSQSLELDLWLEGARPRARRMWSRMLIILLFADYINAIAPACVCVCVCNYLIYFNSIPTGATRSGHGCGRFAYDAATTRTTANSESELSLYCTRKSQAA